MISLGIMLHRASSSELLPQATVVAAAWAWLLLLLVSPYLVSHNPPSGVAFHLSASVYLAGRLVCHQFADRSFHAWGVQLPVCGRCFGLYAAAAAGSLAGLGSLISGRYDRLSARRLAPGAWRLLLVACAGPTLLSVGLEFVGIWRQSPAIRAIAALPLGIVVGWFVTAHAAEVFERLSKIERRRSKVESR